MGSAVLPSDPALPPGPARGRVCPRPANAIPVTFFGGNFNDFPQALFILNALLTATLPFIALIQLPAFAPTPNRCIPLLTLDALGATTVTLAIVFTLFLVVLALTLVLLARSPHRPCHRPHRRPCRHVVGQRIAEVSEWQVHVAEARHRRRKRQDALSLRS